MDEKRDNSEYGSGEMRSPYSDAYYRQAPSSRQGCYGYSPAQCYARASDVSAEPPQRRRNGLASAVVVCLGLLIAAGLLWGGGMLLTYRAGASGQEPASREIYEDYTIAVEAEAENDDSLPLDQSSAGAREELSAEEIYTRACRSTVGVALPGQAYNVFGQISASTVTGTGIVLSEDGYILTNYHVIEDAYRQGLRIQVLTYEDEEYDAEVVGVETDSDLAVLKIEAEGLTPAELGDSAELRVGQTIYTVGNPLGELTYTMTSGIVSALDRQVTTDVNVTVNMFQIDAAVNSGNSGGPVFNTCGQVIGVVTAKYSLSGMEGLGFAIPVNDACKIARDLVEKGYVTGKAYLGLTTATVSPAVARYYDMAQGVFIYDVEAGSCAEAAGLMEGDIITAIDGVEVKNTTELAAAVKGYRAGDSAELTVVRDQAYITVQVVFDEELPAERTETVEDASPEIVTREG